MYTCFIDMIYFIYSLLCVYKYIISLYFLFHHCYAINILIINTFIDLQASRLTADQLADIESIAEPAEVPAEDDDDYDYDGGILHYPQHTFASLL